MSSAPAISKFKLIENLIHEPFRKRQILRGIFQQHAVHWTDINSVPKNMLENLASNYGSNVLNRFRIVSDVVVDKPLAEKSRKSLIESSADSARVEIVEMEYERGSRSVCISSQVGCAMRCSFCATGRMGFRRQLSSEEIVDQVLLVTQNGRGVDSIDFMGMGEPLMNPQLFDALQMLTSPEYAGISSRRLNVSTVGIIAGIQKLSREFPQVNLAVSIHSPFADERVKIVPSERTNPLSGIMQAMKEHVQANSRKLFLSYTLLRGENDSLEHASALAALIEAMPKKLRHLFHVNLIRWNPVPGINSNRASENQTRSFEKVLINAGIHVTVRQSFGLDIGAACGQLAT